MCVSKHCLWIWGGGDCKYRENFITIRRFLNSDFLPVLEVFKETQKNVEKWIMWYSLYQKGNCGVQTTDFVYSTQRPYVKKGKCTFMF